MIVDRMNLSEMMPFDHVIRVLPGGLLVDSTEDAPELTDGQLDTGGKAWELMNGYSGQHGYSGPEMHASEYIGGRMADDILSTPGLYVNIIATHTCEDCGGGDTAERYLCNTCDAAGFTWDGWAVARITD